MQAARVGAWRAGVMPEADAGSAQAAARHCARVLGCRGQAALQCLVAAQGTGTLQLLAVSQVRSRVLLGIQCHLVIKPPSMGNFPHSRD